MPAPSAVQGPVRVLQCRGRELAVGGMTRVVGILNVTPDSFYDGGRWSDPGQAERHARAMAADGAAMIDVGGQSTRPGHEEVAAEVEVARVRPVLERLAGEFRVPISIDTGKAAVARAAFASGANLVNDIHGFQGDPEMARTVAEHGCPAILMHHDRGFPGETGDLIDAMKRYFERSIGIAAAAGVPAARIILDPGIGFHKTQPQNLEILSRVPELKSFGLPLLLGISRKSVIGHVLGGGPGDRLEGTLASSVVAAFQGVEFVRVHDVAANAKAIRMAEAILSARAGAKKEV
jgi:dihydropteroate synthase